MRDSQFQKGESTFDSIQRHINSSHGKTSGFRQLIFYSFLAWVALVPICLLLALVLPNAGVAVLILFLFASVVVFLPALRLLLGIREVLSRKEISLFFGIAKLIAWDPIEAVLVLKNKQVSYVDDNLYDGGGIKVIFPILGEELACRAPLDIQTLDFRDGNVVTKEYLPLTIEGTVKWRIINLQRFYLLVSQGIKAVTDQSMFKEMREKQRDVHTPVASRKIESAEQWLRYIAEEQTRSVVAHVNTGLLVAERIAADLPPELKDKIEPSIAQGTASPTSTAKFRSATDGLAVSIQTNMTLRIKDFGIEVHEVTLQEVRLPQHIHEAAVEACKSAYLPLVAQREAAARKFQLQAEAEVIGADTVGTREVISHAPAYALGDFLMNYLASNRLIGQKK